MPESGKNDKLKDLPTKSPTAAAEAREQAQSYDSLFSPTLLTFDDGSVISIPPHPSLRMLDDDALEAWDALQFEAETYDRHPDEDVSEQNVYDANGNLVTTLPPTTRKGDLIGPPYRKGGVPISPPWEVRTAQAALGEKEYERLRNGKFDGQRGGARHVWKVWNKQGFELAERRAADPKSNGGSVDLAPVSETDRAGSAPLPPTTDS